MKVPDKQTLVTTIIRVRENLKRELFNFTAKLKNIEGNNLALGKLHLERGNLADAEFRFKLITWLNPKHVEALAGLTNVLSLRGKTLQAESARTRLRRLAPSHAMFTAADA